jgi:AraC family transcriptional activator of pobA
MISQIPVHSFKEMGIDEAMAKIILWSEPPKYNIEEIHSHDFYELLIYRKGGGYHTINYQKEPIQDHSIHVVSKSSTHLSDRSRESEGFTIAFSDMYLSQLQQFDSSIDYRDFFMQPGFIHFNKSEFGELDVLLSELIKNEGNRSYFLNLLASVLCKIILLNKHTMLTQKTDELVSEFRDYLSHHYLEKTVVDDFLEQGNYSRTVFGRRLKKVTGLTPLQMVHQKLHLEAKKMLYNTNDSIKEIAYRLNFDDESYFCKFFKSQEDLSPNEFRKKYK